MNSSAQKVAGQPEGSLSENLVSLSMTLRRISRRVEYERKWLHGRIEANRAIDDEATDENLSGGFIDQMEADGRRSVDEVLLARSEVDGHLDVMIAATRSLAGAAEILHQIALHPRLVRPGIAGAIAAWFASVLGSRSGVSGP